MKVEDAEIWLNKLFCDSPMHEMSGQVIDLIQRQQAVVDAAAELVEKECIGCPFRPVTCKKCNVYKFKDALQKAGAI